jgi:hypothetical protein
MDSARVARRKQIHRQDPDHVPVPRLRAALSRLAPYAGFVFLVGWSIFLVVRGEWWSVAGLVASVVTCGVLTAIKQRRG